METIKTCNNLRQSIMILGKTIEVRSVPNDNNDLIQIKFYWMWVDRSAEYQFNIYRSYLNDFTDNLTIEIMNYNKIIYIDLNDLNESELNELKLTLMSI